MQDHDKILRQIFDNLTELVRPDSAPNYKQILERNRDLLRQGGFGDEVRNAHARQYMRLLQQLSRRRHERFQTQMQQKIDRRWQEEHRSKTGNPGMSPQQRAHFISKYRRHFEQYSQDHADTPSTREMARFMGLTYDQMRHFHRTMPELKKIRGK